MPVFLLAALLDVSGSPAPVIATVGQAAILRPLVEAAARCSAAPQLVIALIGFTPPSGGHARLVVSLQVADGRRTELGTVGIFPEQAFAAPPAEAKRFGFALPSEMVARNPSVVVELAVDGGTSGQALIGEARIGPAPQERC